ncbi:unnamed protein product [Parnassius apollo]|uniref:(apollo) hypothetical protein n=1 Tax=Parnassius apollo TaxID=110799 RepID=A0A8S3X0R0_PARAO|nr:unnamed protein product [Parnassius apollo]
MTVPGKGDTLGPETRPLSTSQGVDATQRLAGAGSAWRLKGADAAQQFVDADAAQWLTGLGVMLSLAGTGVAQQLAGTGAAQRLAGTDLTHEDVRVVRYGPIRESVAPSDNTISRPINNIRTQA